MFDQLGPKRKSLRFESLESRVAPGVFLPFWLGAFEVDPAVTESVVRSVQEKEEGGGSQRRMGDSPVRMKTFPTTDGPMAHPTRVQAQESPFIRFPAVQTPTASNLLASLFGGYERDAEAPILKSRGMANFASRGAAAFGFIGGGANTGGGGGAGDSGAPTGVGSGNASAGTSASGVSFVPPTNGTSASGATGSASGSAASEGTGTASGTQTTTTSTEAGLLLTDAEGNAVDIAFDGNTIVIGAATWCSACAQFKQVVSDPGAQAQIEGLRLVFAFGDEGGSGPGGVLHQEYLANLPGDVLFLASGSVKPESFPSAFNVATGKFDQHPNDAIQDWWLANTPQGREAAAALVVPPSGGNDAAFPPEGGTTNGGLALVDASGDALDVRLDGNTLVVGAATWCGATQKFVAALKTPEVAAQLEGLRIVFAFDNEGGDGPGGVLDASFLENLPGEVAFLARGSVRPERLPSVYNAESGQFDRSAVEAVNLWLGNSLLTGGMCGNRNLEGASGEERGASDSVPSPRGGELGWGQAESIEIPSSNELPPPPQPSPSGGGSGGEEENGPGGGGSVLAGDYNGDGRVDAIDYVVFRDTFGSDTDLRADGSEDLSINLADYPVWVANFGLMQGPGAFSITAPLSPITTDDILIQWEASAFATSYQVVLSDHADLSDPFIESEVTGTSKAYNDVGERTLYIGVFAMNAAGSTPATNGPYSLVIDTPDLRQIIFVTEVEYYVDVIDDIPPSTLYFGSALAADYQCTRAASAAGLLDEPWDGNTLHYSALITVDFIALVDRAGVGNQGFVNVNGDQVAADQAELYSGNFTAPILTQNGNAIVGIAPVWTGSTSTGQWSGATCSNWMSPFLAGATVGNVNGVGGTWLNNGTRICHLGARLYCISN